MREPEFQEFISKVVPLKRGKGKIRNSYGVYDYYKFYRKERPEDKKWYLSEKQYYTILREINKRIAKELSFGGSISFPYNMGKVELIRAKRKDSLVDGKLVTKRPIDWDRTLRLWYEDEEAYKNKTLLRTEYEYADKLLYRKDATQFKFMRYYDFTPCRDLNLKIAENKRNNLLSPLYIDNKIDKHLKSFYND